MGSSYEICLNIIACGTNLINTDLINRIFPDVINGNQRKLQRKKDKLLYTATIYRGEINSDNNLNRITRQINRDFDDIQSQQKPLKNDIILYFSDENSTFQQNFESWILFLNLINTLPEIKIPFIILLSYGELDEINNIVHEDIFENFKDKRKITIIRLLRNDIEVTYKRIISYLWKLNLMINQKPFRLSNEPNENIYNIQDPVPLSTINILLTGFSRVGKSTFINMIFDKIVSLESPSFFPVTKETIELLLPSEPHENGVIKGGLKIFDVPGLIQGTTENMDNIIGMVNESIRNQEYNFDVINYIFFFLSPPGNFITISHFFEKLNRSGIKVIFIINRELPRNNGRPNTTKETLIDYLRSNRFNNLLKENGNNIIEVDLINGVDGRINELFSYIHNDLISHNNLNENAINEINHLQNRQLYNYLHRNFDFFQNISSTEDLINRGIKKADMIAAATIPLIVASGFCPIPFVDIPIFLFLTALMLIKIFNSFGFNINTQIFVDFFNDYNRGNRVNRIHNGFNENERMTLTTRIFNWLSQHFEEANNENTKFIIFELIKALELRLGVAAVTGLLDFIPGGFIVAGIIQGLINTPFILKISKDSKNFLINKIRVSGGRENILNMIEGYRDSVSILDRLTNKHDWKRKIQIVDIRNI